MGKNSQKLDSCSRSEAELVNELARLFRSESRDHVERVLSFYRPILRAIVSEKCPQKLIGRIDVSGVVQEGLMHGYARREQFQGTTDEELSAWFREIVLNLIIDAERFHHREKRDISKEASGETATHSIDHGLSPSKEFRRSEDLLEVTDALKLLTDREQAALLWRSEEQTFGEIGKRLDLTEDAARMLWGRALKRMMRLVDRSE